MGWARAHCTSGGYNFCSLGDGTLGLRLGPQSWLFLRMAVWWVRPFTSLGLSLFICKMRGLDWNERWVLFSPATLFWAVGQPRSHLWCGLQRCCIGWELAYSSESQGISCLNNSGGGSLYPEASLHVLALTKVEMLWKLLEFHVLEVHHGAPTTL